MNITTVLRCALAGGVILLAGCGGTQGLTRAFGIARDTPDEFTVTTRAPLSMPPDFTLRPPQPGAARPQELTPTQSAQIAIAGSEALNAPTGGADSPGQDALLAAAGVPAPGDIRAKVDAEAAAAANDRSLADMLMFWKTKSPKGTVVDPSKEAERLRDNAALGKSPDTGDTAIIQKKQQGFFENMF